LRDAVDLPGPGAGADGARRPRPRSGKRRLPIAWVASALALLPLAWLVADAFLGRLGVEPVEVVVRRSGWWALTLLIVTLAVTPLRRLTGWNSVVQARRALGLWAFGYASLHVLLYVGLDQGFGWSYILEDILERPFITAGFVAFVLLVPLAATSTRDSIRRLGGKRWQRLHRLVYPAAMLAVLHFFWLVKADVREPLLFAGVLALLLAARLPTWRSGMRGTRDGVSRSRPAPEKRAVRESPGG
jgi:methionine sulfoxide reductase heme-binding subunit